MRLKKLRERFGHTQRDLAEMLKTTQQTVGRWEAGKVEPNIAALRDLAMIYDVSIDYLVGHANASNATSRYFRFAESSGLDGYWGNIGLLHPVDEFTKWYPISVNQMEAAYSAVQISGRTGNPIAVETLNNRILVFKPEHFDRVWFLDDACDHISDDWNVGPDSVQGKPTEFYSGLQSYLNSIQVDSNWEESTSETYREIITEFVDRHRLTEEDLENMLEKTVVRLHSGREVSLYASHEDVFSLVSDCDDPEYSEPNTQFRMNCDNGGFESFFNWKRVAMVDTPLIPFQKGLQEFLAELEES